MNKRLVLLVVAAVGGLVSGPFALESAARSEPPIDWVSLAFAFVGCLVAIPVVLGLQVATRNYKALRWGWSLFLLVAAYFTASGIAALAVSAAGSGLLPHSFLFLVIGVASLAGLALVKALFARRFANGI